MSDTAGLLRGLTKAATNAVAELQTGARFTDARPTADGMVVHYTDSGAECKVRGRFLVGADGPLSRVTEVSGLHRNRRFLVGAEWIVEGISPPAHTFSLIFDHTLASGYCAWLAPGGEHAALGVAGYARQFRPAQALRQAADEFGALVETSRLHQVRRKGGLITIDRRPWEMYNEHVLLLVERQLQWERHTLSVLVHRAATLE